MTNEPTVQDLLDRIDQMEQRLAPPPEPPTMNEILRAEIDRVRDLNTVTLTSDVVTEAPANVNTGADGGKGGVTKSPPNINAALNKLIRGY